MLEVYNKDGTLKQIVEKSDIWKNNYMYFLTYNSEYSKLQFTLDFSGGQEIASVFLVGSHSEANDQVFCGVITIKRNGTYLTKNILGNITVTSCSPSGNEVIVRINTATKGCCSLISTAPLVASYRN